MIFKWLNHEHFYNDEKLMVVLSELGMASFSQLQTITGWSKRTLQMRINRIRNRAELPENRDQWLTSFHNPFERTNVKRNVVYALGLEGMDYAKTMKGEMNAARTVPQSQVAHFVGTNEILVRLLKLGIDRKSIQWFHTQEAMEMLFNWTDRVLRNPKEAEKARKESTRPDAMLLLQTKSQEEVYYWVEFDNNTESARPLERKFHRYFKTLEVLEPLGIDFPVLWVTINDNRKRYLSDVYRDMIEHFYRTKRVPEMQFFVAGEETAFLAQQLPKTSSLTEEIVSPTDDELTTRTAPATTSAPLLIRKPRL